jgi:cytochrome c oxidase cbb3-type subunit III
MPRHAAIFVLCLAGLCAAPLPAQQPAASTPPPLQEGSVRNVPKFDPAAVSRGHDLFAASCGFCHGRDARGTGAGPDMTTASVVLNDEGGKGLTQFLQTGRPQKGMPAFPGLSAEQVSDIAAFLHSAVAETHSRSFKSGASILVGDSAAGQAYFNGTGKCSTCHSPDKDLKGIASKLDNATLQDRLIYPEARGSGSSPAPADVSKTVMVTLPSDQVISGTLVAITDFDVTLIDQNGVRRSFARDNDIPKIEVNDPLQAHLDLMTRLTDKQMHDLTAYLATLK